MQGRFGGTETHPAARHSSAAAHTARVSLGALRRALHLQVSLEDGCNATDASGQALAPWTPFTFTVGRTGLIRCAL